MAALFVAFPTELLAGNVDAIQNSFVRDGHHIFFPILILVDVSIAVLLLRDSKIRQKLFCSHGAARTIIPILLVFAIVAVIGLTQGQMAVAGGWLTVALLVSYVWCKGVTFYGDPTARPI